MPGRQTVVAEGVDDDFGHIGVCTSGVLIQLRPKRESAVEKKLLVSFTWGKPSQCNKSVERKTCNIIDAESMIRRLKRIS